jgi:hypothetical protein
MVENILGIQCNVLIQIKIYFFNSIYQKIYDLLVIYIQNNN